MHQLFRHAAVRVIAPALLSLAVLARNVGAQSCVAGIEPPWTIRLPVDLRVLVTQLVDGSPTFKSQWRTLVSSPRLRLAVTLTAKTGPDRARSTVHRYEYGLVVAAVELPSGVDDVELLAHEFEHVLEQLEGVDLRRVAQNPTSGVKDRGYAYETERAYAVGRRVSQEWNRYLKVTNNRSKQPECHAYD